MFVPGCLVGLLGFLPGSGLLSSGGLVAFARCALILFWAGLIGSIRKFLDGIYVSEKGVIVE